MSIRRPILAVAALLTVLMLGGAAFLGVRTGDRIAAAARTDGEALARTTLLNESLTTASAAADRLGDVLRRTRAASEKLADEVERLGPGPLPAPTGLPEFTQFGSPGVLVSNSSNKLMPYRLAPRGADPEQLGALTARMDALEVALRMALDPRKIANPARGIVHVAAWIDGEGLVGQPRPGPEELGKLGGRLAPLGPAVIGGNGVFAPSWRGPEARLTGSRVVSHIVPLTDPKGHVFGVVAADVDFASLETALGIAEDGAGLVLLGADGAVLASSPDLWRSLTTLPEHSSDPDLIVDALTSDSTAVIGKAPVAETGWTVAVVTSPDAVALRAGTASAAGVRTARAVGSALLGYGVLFGALVAVAAFLLSRNLRQRLRPLMEAVAAHAGGDLEHRVVVRGRDELAMLAEGLNSSAQQLRANLQRLSESKRRLSALIEHMGNGLVVTDPSDRITFVNPCFAEMVQRSPADLTGRCVEDLLRPDSADFYRSELARRREGHSGQYEVTWAVPGMRRPRTIVTGMPLYGEDGYYCGSFGVVIDITSRDQAQHEGARARKLRALGAMAGGVAHDFNHVLTIILGNAQLLVEEDLPDEIMETVRTIEHAALDGAERIRRVREFTKLRSAVTEGDALDPNNLIRDVVLRARTWIEAEEKERGVSYELKVRPRAHRPVRGNASELREVLGNIVLNAIQAMPDGGEIVIEAFDRGEDTVGLRIRDAGVGMREEDVERLFDPFFTTRQDRGASGLGLSIAFGIVRAHGGRIDARSKLGEGSALTVVLPAHRASADSGVVKPAAPRVLYAARRADAAKPMQQDLQKLGLYVAVMESYASATAVLTDAAVFNTLLVEHDLGENNGWELARLARKSRPELRIILLSDPSLSPSESQGHNVGIDRILVEPFDARDVHAAIMSAAVAPPARPVVHQRVPVLYEEVGPDKRTMTATGEIVLVARTTGVVYVEPSELEEPAERGEPADD